MLSASRNTCKHEAALKRLQARCAAPKQAHSATVELPNAPHNNKSDSAATHDCCTDKSECYIGYIPLINIITYLFFWAGVTSIEGLPGPQMRVMSLRISSTTNTGSEAAAMTYHSALPSGAMRKMELKKGT